MLALEAGIYEVVNNNMATVARIHVTEQGHDPRLYRLIAFGGAGPVHAYGVARLLHIAEVVFPPAAGVASAVGMLVAPRSVEYTRSLVCPLDALDWGTVGALLRDLEGRARALLGEAGAHDGEVRIEVAADMRYVGQGYEVTVPVDPRIRARRDGPALREAFDAEYRRRFDRPFNGAPVEVISWRLRAALNVAETIAGPAVVEEAESTIVVGPRGRIRLDGNGNLVMRLD